VIKIAKPAPVIIVSDHAKWSRYLAALRAGAFDCIAFTPDDPQIKRTLWSALIEHATVKRIVMSTL
jgi:DNA-binding NtrC family response regulator